MTKQLERPQEIRVSTNIKGVPLTFTRNGQRERVAAIYEQWRVSDEWWGNEVERDYFRIKTNKGFVYDIYRDRTANQWYLSKIYD